MSSDELQELLTLSDDELYVRLAAELQGDGRGIGPKGREGDRRFGRQWFEHWLETNRSAICDHPSVVAIIHDDETREDGEDATIVLDVILPFLGAPPLATVAALVGRRGLQRLCS